MEPEHQDAIVVLALCGLVCGQGGKAFHLFIRQSRLLGRVYAFTKVRAQNINSFALTFALVYIRPCNCWSVEISIVSLSVVHTNTQAFTPKDNAHLRELVRSGAVCVYSRGTERARALLCVVLLRAHLRSGKKLELFLKKNHTVSY